MTGGRASLIWLALLACGVGLFAIAWLTPHLQRIADQSESLGRLELEGEQLAARVQELTTELNRLLAGEESPERVPPEELDAARAGLQAEKARRLRDVRLLAETQRELEEARLTIAELQAKVEDLQDAVRRLESRNRALAEAEAALREQLERSSRVIAAMRAELKSNQERLVKLEARNRTLREQNQKLSRRIERTGTLLTNLERLQRRRENILANIARRYREVSDEYRALALRLGTADERDTEQSLDLGRMENALSLADEDFRTLETLQARANRILEELSK